jgi:TonB family protein
VKERRGVSIKAAIFASIVFHAALVLLLPAERATPSFATPIELVELPAAPPPPAPVTKPADTARATLARKARSVAAPTTAPARTAKSVSAPVPPADFTSPVLASADGHDPSFPAARTSPAKAASARSAPDRGPRFVRVADLARAPRAPALDRALVKNYPAPARRSGISGKAVLRVRILPNGRVGAIRHVSESFAGFGAACERTVRSAAWEPPIDRAGTRVATEVTYTCRFQIEN